MRERPILFSAPMVRALLDGRKTQTRRVVKLPRNWVPNHDSRPDITSNGSLCVEPRGVAVTEDTEDTYDVLRCPYGAPGDRLWVKETWAAPPSCDTIKPSDLDPLTPIRYASDGVVRGVSKRFVDKDGCIAIGKGRPSIFMPRWASRITLEVTGVRVERLQAISEEDAMTEGVDLKSEAWPDFPEAMPISLKPRYAFELLWESINGRDSWAANPWVWVVSFQRVEARCAEV